MLQQSISSNWGCCESNTYINLGCCDSKIFRLYWVLFKVFWAAVRATRVMYQMQAAVRATHVMYQMRVAVAAVRATHLMYQMQAVVRDVSNAGCCKSNVYVEAPGWENTMAVKDGKASNLRPQTA